MTTQNAPAGTSPATGTGTSPAAGMGAIVHTGLSLVPALVVLTVGGVKLWRERSGARREDR